MRETFSESYRGYRIVADPAHGYVEIWFGAEVVDDADSAYEARKVIDGWHDAP